MIRFVVFAVVAAVVVAQPPYSSSDFGTRAQVAQDFGYVISDLPRYTFCPNTTQQVAEIVIYARANDLKLALRGRGHSSDGQSQSQSAVVDSQCLNSIFEVNTARGYIHVGAGVSWADVVAATSAMGYRPLAEVETKLLSVGGTLSIGGGGLLSALEGHTVQHVRGVTVVTGLGEIYFTKPSFRSNIYNGILGGQGQFAVITEVELEIVPIESTFRAYTLVYNNYAQYASDLHTICSSGTMSGVGSISSNTAYGRDFTGPLFPTLLNNTNTKALTESLFGNETAVPYIFYITLGDPQGLYTPNYADETKITLPMASSAGLDAYLAAANTDTELLAEETQNAEYYIPRHLLALHLPASAPGANTTWDLVYDFFSDIFLNPIAEVSMQYLPQGAIETTTVTAWPTDTDVLEVHIILTSYNPLPAQGLSAVASSYESRDFLNDIFEFFYYNELTAGVKLYPYGFTPDIYTWEYHYGAANWDLLKSLKHQYDHKDILGSGTAIFGPRV